MIYKRWIQVGGGLLMLLVWVTAVSASTYQVKKGDTLYSLAKQFNTTINAIASANNIPNANLIYEGQLLEIPDGNSSPIPTPPTPPPSTGGTYTVLPGDTLYRIALQFGTTVAAIAQANAIANINLIQVGQLLIIPGGTVPPPPTTPNSSMELGGQSHGFSQIDLMQQASMNWIKLQVKWSPGQNASDLAGPIQTAHNNNLKILLAITGAQSYPAPGSINFNSFTSFVGEVAALGPDAIEVWNEMNIDFEWPAGEISPATYVNNMLRPAYNAIKAANANVMVISGALAPTGYDNGHNAWADDRYLAGMRAAGAAQFMDCIGVHHNAGATAPNANSGHPGGSHYSWYFRATLDLYYNSFNGLRPVCFTELGYLSGDGFPALPANFSWAAGTSLAEHAQWLGDAVRLAKSLGRVRLLIVYNVDLSQYDVNGDPQAGYAILRPDGSCPACATLSAAMSGN